MPLLNKVKRKGGKERGTEVEGEEGKERRNVKKKQNRQKRKRKEGEKRKILFHKIYESEVFNGTISGR